MPVALLSLVLCLDTTIELRPALTLEPVPESLGLFLQYPFGVEIDERGRFYVLDNLARTVFVWDRDGRFLTHFGKKGEGPGEFSFYGSGSPQGFISVLGDEVYIYDGSRRLLNRFDAEYRFIEAKPFLGSGGRTLYFNMTRDRKILLYQQKYRAEKPSKELALYDSSLNRINVFFQAEDKTFEVKRENGKTVAIIVNAYRPSVVMFCDTANGEIIVGGNDKPEFGVYDSNGSKLRTVRFRVTPKEITPEEREAFVNRPNIRRDSRIKVSFPKRRPYYQIVLPVGRRGYLVFDYSFDHSSVSGVFIDREGRQLGVFQRAVSENGGLFGARGRIFSIGTDGEGEYAIQELLATNVSAME